MATGDVMSSIPSGNLIANFGKLQITDLMRYAWSLIEFEVVRKIANLTSTSNS
jgi:hypothetical protein